MTSHSDHLLTTQQAAAYLNVRPRMLEHLRMVGGGPRYCRIGRQCRYRRDWLDVWLDSRTFESTAEARRRGAL